MDTTERTLLAAVLRHDAKDPRITEASGLSAEHLEDVAFGFDPS
jgi:hypothetical protein